MVNHLDGLCIVGEDFHLRQTSRLSNALKEVFFDEKIKKIKLKKKGDGEGIIFGRGKREIGFTSLYGGLFHYKYHQGDFVRIEIWGESEKMKEHYEEIKVALEYNFELEMAKQSA